MTQLFPSLEMTDLGHGITQGIPLGPVPLQLS